MIQALENKLMTAMKESDIATLQGLFAEDLIYTSPLGNILNKEENLETYRSGLLNISELKTDHQEVFEFDENYIVSGKANLVGNFDQNSLSGTYKFTRIWTKNPSGHYQVICAHSSKV